MHEGMRQKTDCLPRYFSQDSAKSYVGMKDEKGNQKIFEAFERLFGAKFPPKE
jgi:hypothetical protein